MPYTTILFIICCAVFYYRLGESEYSAGFLLGTVSVILWLLGAGLFHFGNGACLALQVGLYVALTCYNMMSDKPPLGGK